MKSNTGEHVPLSGVIVPGSLAKVFPLSPNIVGSNFGNPWMLSPLLLAALCVVQGFWPEFSTNYAWLPFLTSLFFLGMSHGASDFARLGEFLGPVPRIYHFIWFAAYLLGMGLVLLLSLTAPGLSLFCFAVISMWHFGRSDLYPAKIPSPSLLRLASRGLLLLSLPVAVHPGPVRELVDGWMALLGGQPINNSTWEQIILIATISAGLSFTNSMVLIALFGLRRDFGSFRRESLETVVLVTTLVVLNPVFALGAYFLLWHSLRHWKVHIGPGTFSFNRLSELCGLDRRRAILFLPTVAAYLGLSFLLFDSWSPNLQVSLLLIFFAVVTPSHEILHAVIQWSRRREENIVLK